MTRKKPVKHKVKKHTRKGKTVRSYIRGKGQRKNRYIVRREVVDIKVNGILEDIDMGIANNIKRFNQFGFKTGASCEGHLDEGGNLDAFISFVNKKAYDSLWRVAIKNFTPYARSYPRQWQYRPVAKPTLDEGNRTYAFNRELRDYYVGLEFSPKDGSSVVRVIPKKNFDELHTSGKQIKYDEFFPSRKFTGKYPSQVEWNSIRSKAYRNVMDLMKRN